MIQVPNVQSIPPAPGQSPRRSPFFPALIALACAVLLTGGSLFGFLSTCGNFPNTSPQQPINTIFFWASFASIALFFASVVWIVGLSLRRFFTAGKEDA
jgi:hypothetical protein